MPAAPHKKVAGGMPVLDAGLPSTMYLWMSVLPAPMHDRLLRMLRNCKERLGEAPALGTACSGTDLIAKVVKVWDIILEEHGLKFGFVSQFATEMDEKKQAWICHHHPELRSLFGLCSDLARNMATCLKAGQRVVVPYVDVFVAGFSCKSRSSLNKNRKKFLNCIQEQTPCATTDTFEDIWGYIASARPNVVVLENVKNLTDAHGADQSDAEYIVDRFRTHGWWAHIFIMHADEFGSIARRERMYILAVLMRPGVVITPDNVSIEVFAQHLLMAMSKGGTLKDLGDFIKRNENSVSVMTQPPAKRFCSTPQKKTKKKKEQK